MKLEFFSTLSIMLFTPNYINIYYLINLIVILFATYSIILYKHYDLRGKIIITINMFCELLFYYFLLNNFSFLIFITKITQFIFSINLNEIIYKNKKSANLFLPYIIWNYLLTLFATVYLFLNITI